MDFLPLLCVLHIIILFAGVDWLNINLFKLLQTVVGIANVPQSCSYSL